MSESESPSSVIGRKRRPNLTELSTESEGTDGSPVVPQSRKARKRVVATSSDSGSEVESGRRRRKASRRVILTDSEDDSESPREGAVCPICLGRMYESALRGRPDSCAHTFCFECIRTWSKKSSTCVLCRVPFTKVEVLLRDEVLEELPVKEVSLGEDETMVQPAFVLCYACRNYDNGDSTLFCDGCGATYHCDCLDPPLPNAPPGIWRCSCCELESPESDDDLYEPDDSLPWFSDSGSSDDEDIDDFSN